MKKKVLIIAIFLGFFCNAQVTSNDVIVYNNHKSYPYSSDRYDYNDDNEVSIEESKAKASVLVSKQSCRSNLLNVKLLSNKMPNNYAIEIKSKLKSVEIYSLDGEMVMTFNKNNFNVSKLTKGSYMVRIEDENGAFATQKLIR